MSIIAFYICEILSFVPAIILHEVSHGFAAYKLGDPTAKRSGRLTLNPLAHIDPFGSVILPLMLMVIGGPIFGYAKPVPYNPYYFKDKRKGDFIVGIAGPLANLALAIIGSVLAWALYPAAAQGIHSQMFLYFYFLFLPNFVLINLFLMFFNLLPIPPLDGSSIFAVVLPEKYLHYYYTVERYAMPILLVLLFIVPYVFHVNPIALYMQFFAGNFANLLYPYPIM